MEGAASKDDKDFGDSEFDEFARLGVKSSMDL